MNSQINKSLNYYFILSKFPRKLKFIKTVFYRVQVNRTITVINKERFFIYNNILQIVIKNINFLKSFENEIEDNNEKNAAYSAIHFLINRVYGLCSSHRPAASVGVKALIVYILILYIIKG